jgi:hypothetical protein
MCRTSNRTAGRWGVAIVGFSHTAQEHRGPGAERVSAGGTGDAEPWESRGELLDKRVSYDTDVVHIPMPPACPGVVYVLRYTRANSNSHASFFLPPAPPRPAREDPRRW